MKSIFLCNNPEHIREVYPESTISALTASAGLDRTVYSSEDVRKNPEKFRDTRYVFSTWGMPSLREDEIKSVFPSLECVFYAAGTVQGFAKPFISCGVHVFSAWAANAVPVAEYTVAQIILANKGFFASAGLMSRGNTALAARQKEIRRGNYGEKVGVIGAGMIGKLVIKLLRAYRLEVLAFDPFLPDETARELNVTKCDLHELFESCYVVSNHLANNAQTRGMLDGECFRLMRPDATFINTGRGAQVNESDLAGVLLSRPDLTAILDVTDPEPPQSTSPLYSLENCILTPHIAGSLGDETGRMSEYMVQEFERFTSGEPCLYEVSAKMLETMA